MNARPAVLVIAGTDSSGGAGLTRDVSVLTEFKVDALCVVTAVTAQSNTEVRAVHYVPPQLVRAQMAAALASREVDAIKIGMLGMRETVEAVADALPSRASVPIVLDPVLVASSGGVLLDESGREAMRAQLFPRVTLVTPNVPEACALLRGDPADSETATLEQAKRLLRLGPAAVLLKGGHAQGEAAIDWLVSGPESVLKLASPRVHVTARGTGCTLASAIAAGLAAGKSLDEACQVAKRYVTDFLNRARA